MNIPLRCRCGKLEGEVDASRVKARAICYCKDCQAFARFLKAQDAVLDASGGTEVEAMLPSGVRFTKGLEHLACLSLSPKGIYRWYASCCDTPVGNTPRNPKAAYLGLVRTCLAAPDEELDRRLGRSHITANTGSAHGPAKTTPVATVFAVASLGTMLVKARLDGGWRDNPFFDTAGAPVRTPRVLTREERAAVTP
ncbi:DUF6151 family protein [Massilia sp. Leaf139]|uniref:DUF6151 family protein n=1 Tax=Massilia sp. Leaf139 TaxID=1736272 RepID=UPI0006FFEAE8|nr:DUF6151 family protein [Massilia sp. Leaf139]KQQ97108.1 hypothetical protein ASF77_03870 [Massilia sp. Leaf139]